MIGLPVETKSGQRLGSVSHFDLEVDEQRVIRYYVKSSRMITGLLRQELMVGVDQVVSITKEKMIVEDNLSRETKISEEKVAPAST
ncbi:MAG: PRC-barrel domain-containing protein [Patescibacteria group bacterium]